MVSGGKSLKVRGNFFGPGWGLGQKYHNPLKVQGVRVVRVKNGAKKMRALAAHAKTACLVCINRMQRNRQKFS